MSAFKVVDLNWKQHGIQDLSCASGDKSVGSKQGSLGILEEGFLNFVQCLTETKNLSWLLNIHKTK